MATQEIADMQALSADRQAVVQIETGAHPSYTARMGPVKKKAPPVVADVEVPGGTGAALEEMVEIEPGEAKLSLKDLKSMVPGGKDEVKGKVEKEKVEVMPEANVLSALSARQAGDRQVEAPAVEEPEEVPLSLKDLKSMRRRKRKKRG